MTRWQRMVEGNTKGIPLPYDEEIKKMLAAGMSQRQMARALGKTRTAIQQRIYRIAAQEYANDD